ncbi:MAG TPA: ComEC/Rec2 family competence protein [Allosphingosinicella sp.]|nr:ComEC/Rec2 family competence protein [Allosphingosinicella sp.]
MRERFTAVSDWLETKAEAERGQLPLWLPVGLGLGIAAFFILPDRHAWIAFLLAAASFFFACLAAGFGTIWGRALAIFAAAALIGGADAWWEADRVAAPRIEAEKVVTFQAQVEAISHVATADKVRLTVRPLNMPDLPPHLRLNVEPAKAPKVRPGAVVETRAWLMPPAPAQVPDAYDFSRTAWFMPLGGSGRTLDLKVVSDQGPTGWRGWMEGLRQRLGEHIRKQLSGGEGEIAVALVNGDQDGIPKTDNDAMRRSGLAHLLSVSGLHLTAVVGAVMLLTLRLLALSPWLALRFRLTLIAAATGALAGIAYTILTGSQVPTIRSCIASLLVLGGIALGREALTLRLVATGALIILLLWPDSLVGPSFQLSFAAIAAIVVLHDHPKIRAFLAKREEGFPIRLLRGVAGLILTGLVVELALTPIGLYHFHRAGLYGTFANIIAIPLTTFVIMPAEALSLLFDVAGLGAPFWWVTGKAIHLLLIIAHGTGEAPGAVALLPAMADGAFALMIVGALWMGLWRTKWRRWGLIPFAVGAVWALFAPRPDLLVTGDGRHVAFLGPDGKVGILRTRARDYVRSTIAESFATDDNLPDVDDLKGATCTDDSCLVTMWRDGRPWRILATRTKTPFDKGPLAKACAAADIVVSERYLPRDCTPRWLKIDPRLLKRTGGLSIRLGASPSVKTVAQGVGRHPWSYYGPRHQPRYRSRSWPAPHR